MVVPSGVSMSIASALVLPFGTTASRGMRPANASGRRLITSRTVPSPPSITSRSTPSDAKRRRPAISCAGASGTISSTSSGSGVRPTP